VTRCGEGCGRAARGGIRAAKGRMLYPARFPGYDERRRSICASD